MSITLDDDEDEQHEEIDFDRLIVAEPPVQSRAPVNLRPLAVGLVVLVLGGGLGTAAYFASTLDVHDVIGALDVADQGPKLSMEMPGRGGSGPAATPAPAAPESPAATPAAPEVPAAPATTATPPPPPSSSATESPVQPPVVVAVAPPPSGPQIPAAPAFRDPGPPPSYSALPARVEASQALAPVPDKMLFRDTPDGPLPIIALDGRQPWQVYAHPYQSREGWPNLSVVVAGLGLSSEATETAIQKLPAQVTLSFSPYAVGLDKWVKAARDAGHEVLVGLPTEPSGYPDRDPGPWGLLTSQDAEENISLMEKVLVRLPGHVGVLAEEGPFVRSQAHLKPILDTLKDRGLLYVGQGATGDDLPPHADVLDVADRQPFREAIDARLAHAAAEAKKNGRSLVVVSASPVSLDRLAAFFARLPGQAIRLAPATAVAIAPPTGKS